MKRNPYAKVLKDPRGPFKASVVTSKKVYSRKGRTTTRDDLMSL